MNGVRETVRRLASGSRTRTEADIQSDVRKLLLDAPLELEDDQVVEISLEAQVGGGRRIDVEAGRAVFEVKKSLRSPRVFDEAVVQLRGYVHDRTAEQGQRFVGVLTDGQTWILFHLTPAGTLAEVARLDVRGAEDTERLASWLEAVLATRDKVKPTPKEIRHRLGAESPAAQLDLADLRALYSACRTVPEVQLKRELWARLLLSALGTNFEDSDELFVTHTYLVVVAELVAHEVVGLPVDVPGQDVRGLLEGERFASRQLYGVVEADFFDWPAATSAGAPVISAIARRLSRIDWSDTEHDVLKELYESVIDTETRHKLGEYYTPDWLAQKIVDEHISEPLRQRVLDPACGSGTFLFWAVRRVLAACDDEGLPNDEAIRTVVRRVQGLDLHPVAVTLARVTYLLALTPARLAAHRDEVTVPVFLSDAVRWEQDDTVRTDNGMTVRTTDQLEFFDQDLHFPEAVLEQPARFDRLVVALADKARSRLTAAIPRIGGVLNAHHVEDPQDRRAVELVFAKLCRLHDAGRDHLWSYYIRNLARPLAFTRRDGHADVLVGNPPWLAYRSMPAKQQLTYRTLAEERGLWTGGTVATHQDLSDLFVARSVEQYLRPGGTFAFVMPFAALSRRQFAGFRSGRWTNGSVGACARFNPAEEFARVKPPPFPVPCCVISGYRDRQPGALPAGAKVWRGRVPRRYLDWLTASEHLTSEDEGAAAGPVTKFSPYRQQFSQGATLLPRVLLTVEPADAGPLGVASGRRLVRSARSATEKPPWKTLGPLEGVVEEPFVRPLHLGSTILAYRAQQPKLAIVPWADGEFLDGTSERLDEFPGLAAWWRRAEQVWNAHKAEATRLSLREQVDFQGKLKRQFPTPPLRVVYSASGQHLAACRIDDAKVVIDKSLYWAPVNSIEEGRYLTAVLNSGVLAAAVAGSQSRGQHNPRHFDLTVFTLPFPTYDPRDELHRALANLAERAETVAAAVTLDSSWQFQKARRVVRGALRDDGVAEEIDRAVTAVLEPTPDLMTVFAASERAANRREGAPSTTGVRSAKRSDKTGGTRSARASNGRADPR